MEAPEAAKSAFSSSTITNGWFEGDNERIRTSYLCRLCVLKEALRKNQKLLLSNPSSNNCGRKVSSSSVSIQQSKSMARHHGKKMSGYLRESPKKEDSSRKELRVQIFEDGLLVADVDVSEKIKAFAPSTLYQRCSFSSSATHFIFVAEPKAPPFHDYCGEQDSETESDSKEGKVSKFLWKDHNGEQLDNVSIPQIYCLDIESKKLDCISAALMEDRIACGQPFITSTDDVLFVGWPETLPNMRLGMLYCYNRPSILYSVSLKGENMHEISTDAFGPTNPRVNDQGNLIYQAAADKPYHNYALEIRCKDLNTLDEYTVVHTDDKLNMTEHFPGYFAARDQFIDDPFVSNDWFLFESQWHSEKAIVVVNIFSGKKVRLFEELNGSMSILSTYKLGDTCYVAIRHSSPVHSCQVFAARLRATTDNIEVENMFLVHDYGAATDPVAQWSRIWTNLEDDHVPRECHAVESIFMWPGNNKSPSADNPLPCVVMAHGGPHSAYPADFVPFSVGFLKLGFAVIATNFRGSVGYGQGFVECLPGRCGSLDVGDVLRVVSSSISNKLIDQDRLVICGGSHGGFVALHSIAQSPTLFKAAIVRNPVTCISQMVGVTDIWDWCYVEAGLPFDRTSILDNGASDMMFRSSPMNNIVDVKTPTLLLVGGRDKRVPCSQGFSYYRGLRALGVETELHYYPDAQHPLNDNVECEVDSLTQALRWVQKYV